MQLKFAQNLLPGKEQITRVTALAYAPNGQKLAAVTTERVVFLFDENGEKKDRFKARSSVKDAAAARPFHVRGMAFSPDSTRLAVAQSDNIVFIYKLGSEWGDKKSICNKFEVPTPVTCVCWSPSDPNLVAFGCADGSVRAGYLRTNKTDTLYTRAPVTAICTSPDGRSLATAHTDGAIVLFDFADAGSFRQLAVHPCPPSFLAWGVDLAAAGPSGHVVFYESRSGRARSTFPPDPDAPTADVGCGAASPAGDTVVVAAHDALVVYSWRPRELKWEQTGRRAVPNMYAGTALAFRPDGAGVVVGTLTGCVDVFESMLRKVKYVGTDAMGHAKEVHLSYTSKSQVRLRDATTGASIAVGSAHGHEIDSVKVHHGEFVVATTSHTLLLGSMATRRFSEIKWAATGKERFYCDDPAACVVYAAGELTVIEYGSSEPLWSGRTEFPSKYVRSLCLVPARDATPAVKRLAYLLDAQTVRVVDLASGQALAAMTHEHRITFLEMSHRGTHVMFKDKRNNLFLLDVSTQQRRTMASSVSYCQWAPASDVMVAQSGSSFVVWYSVSDASQQQVIPIRGDVTGMVRVEGRTQVTVQGPETVDTFELDESNIVFDAAIEGRDWWAAVEVLSGQPPGEAEARWRALGHRAMEDGDLVVAEMAFATVGDLPKARYIQRIRALAHESERATGRPGMDHWLVRARLQVLNGRQDDAESLLLQNGAVEEAVQLHKGMGRWEDAIRVADRYAHPEGNKLKRMHYQWLLDSRQEDKAAKIKEREGDYLAAISLYLRGGFPAQAAKVIMGQGKGGAGVEPSLVAKVTEALKRAGMHQMTGELMEHQGDAAGALDAFVRGHCFERAIQLCRRSFPDRVAEVEDTWGEWHAANRQWDAAVNHFIEAQNYDRAIDAAIHAKQWAKAVAFANTTLRGDPTRAAAVYKRVARHYEDSGDLSEAERLYREADCPVDAWTMYVGAGKHEAAWRVASECLREAERSLLYLQKAGEAERAGNLRDAERLYLTVGEADKAIFMYKKEGRFEDMIRLVSKHRKELLTETHLHLAQQLEGQSRLREAEKHYVEAREWKQAVHMYRNAEQWDDALRVAKACGGPNAAKQVAFARAMALGGEAGAQYLSRHGLVDQAIEYAVESANFTMAFELAQTGAKGKEAEVHLKYAMYLEDEGEFAKAESHFIQASKPREAIDMWLHQQDFAAAMRVAEGHDAASVRDVQIAQATSLAEQGDFAAAEKLFIDAKEPERAVDMYKDHHDWQSALRLAQAWLPPHKQREIREAQAAVLGGAHSASGRRLDALAIAKGLEMQRNFPGAIEAYLSISEADVADPDKLQRAWEQAVALAEDWTPDSAPSVVKRASDKLVELGRHSAAAELYQGVRDVRSACRVYTSVGMWGEAAQLAESSNDPDLVEMVKAERAQALAKAGDVEGLAAAGAGRQSLDMLAQRGQWDRVHEMARPMGPEVANAYAARHAQIKAQSKDWGGAAIVLDKHMASFDPKLLPLYLSVAKGCLALSQGKDSAESADATRRILRMAMGGAPASQASEMRRMADAAHYLKLHKQCAKEGMHALAAMQATALLRLVPAVPADKAFMLAGSAWRAANDAAGGEDDESASMAFVLLNKLLDIYDAMEEAASGGDPAIEMADFTETDLPQEVPLPTESYLDADAVERVRDWVLEKSMEQRVEQALHTRICDRCSTDTFKGSLTCHGCKAASPQCCVSGYPVEDRHACTVNASHVASRDAWNQYVERFGCCAVCNAPQQSHY